MLGLVHTIIEQKQAHEFVIENEYTGEKTIVSVDPDKYNLFSDQDIFSKYPHSCPFFRYNKEETIGYCTCHLTRPAICHDYGCWRILILSHSKRVGRIMNWRHMCAETAEIQDIWEKYSHNLSGLTDEMWDKQVIHLFQKHGFQVMQ